MRLVTYGAACSLDGFIAGANNAIDWLHFSKEVQEAMSAYWGSIDTILMGRRTWEDALARQGKSRSTHGNGARETSTRTNKKKPRTRKSSPFTTYVFSRTLAPDEVDDAELVADDAGDFVRALKAREGKGICVMGGGELATSLLAAGVIDEIGLNIHPILLGSGVPLFRDAGHRVALELASTRAIEGGCVLANYRVRRNT